MDIHAQIYHLLYIMYNIPLTAWVAIVTIGWLPIATEETVRCVRMLYWYNLFRFGHPLHSVTFKDEPIILL